MVHFVTKSPLDYTEEYEKGYLSLSGSAGSYNSLTSSLIYVTPRDTESHSGIKVSAAWDDIRQFEPRGSNARDKVFGEIRYEKDFSDGNGTHILELTGGASQQKFNVLIPTVPRNPSRFGTR